MEDYFDWEYYINKYIDLQQAGINNYDLAWQHWKNNGRNEGRICLEIQNDFDWIYYAQNNTDVDCPHEIIAYEHYLNYGRYENRKINNFEEKRVEEEARKRKEEEENKRRTEEEARKRTEEEENKRRAEKEARKRTEEEENKRRAKKEENKRRAEEETRKRSEEEARKRSEEEARKRSEEEARKRAEEEARKRAEEEARKRAGEEARKRAGEEARKRAEEEARKLSDKLENAIKADCKINLKLNTSKKISIVMAYYNRKQQTLNTLDCFERIYKNLYNYEVIIVDDNSNESEQIDDYIKNYSYNIKLIKITETEKDSRINSCEVYNKGFKESSGDIIIVQNPECLHLGNILEYIINNFHYDDYLSFPCYNSNNYEVNKYIINNLETLNINNIETKTTHFNEDATGPGWPKWYQHPTINNRNLHFCCAIDKEYLQMIGGFSEKYKYGVCYEDDNLLFKIKTKLKLNVISVPLSSNVGVVHLYHGRSAGVNIGPNEKDIKRKANYEKFCLNENLFNYEKKIDKKFSTPKIFHYYWDDFKKFSYMNLYSLKSSVHYHPDFIHIIWCPKNPEKNITWTEFCNKDYIYDTNWEKYIEEIKNLKTVEIIYKDIGSFINVDQKMSEIHKSDLFRYKILHKYGGIWSDLDIVYIKHITDVINFEFDTINFLCTVYSKKCICRERNSEEFGDNFTDHEPNTCPLALYMPIGLMLSKRKSSLFNSIFEIAKDNYNPDKYQSVGAEVFTKIFFNTQGKNSGIGLDQEESKKLVRPDSKMYDFNNSVFNLQYTNDNLLLFDHNSGKKNVVLDEKYYIYFNWTKIDDLFVHNSDTLPKEIFGFHWFNGSPETKKYLKEIINYNIPDKFNGVIFKEKSKFNNNITKIKYFDVGIDNWANFYKNKLNTYLKIIETKTDINIDAINIKDYNIVFNNQKEINFWETWRYNEEELYLFDEISYSYIRSVYIYCNNNLIKNNILNFLNNANYIVFFCELFKNNELQTIGNDIKNFEYTNSFFKNANRIILCNTKNINYLYNNNIFNNITYFPPLGYSDIYNNDNKLDNSNEKNTDVLFYGNIVENFNYRKKGLDCIENLCKEKNYKFICRDNLYDDNEKNILFEDTKIVIHIPSHENLHSFPWAKVSELMLKKIFFIIEENEEMYIKGLDKLCAFYKGNDIVDLENKIKYYINNESERINITTKCYKYFIANYNIDTILNKFNLQLCNKYVNNVCSIKYKLDNNLRFYIEKQELYLSVIKNTHKHKITYIDIDFYSFGYPKDNFENDCNKLKLILEKTSDSNLFLFNELDFSNLREFYNYSDEFKNLLIKFLSNTNYMIFFCEILINDKFQTKGSDVINEEYAKLIFSNASKIICCDTKNKEYLSKIIVPYKIIYFPPIGYTKINDKPLIKNKQIDIDLLFYGNINPSWIPYRSKILNEIGNIADKNKLNFINGTFHDCEKNNLLKRSKIIIHIPSYENLRTFPWAKTVELMLKKVFFIIEENEEMYNNKLNDVVIYYKSDNLRDLEEKIDYFIKNTDERTKVINRCYEYIKSTYNMDNLFTFNT